MADAILYRLLLSLACDAAMTSWICRKAQIVVNSVCGSWLLPSGLFIDIDAVVHFLNPQSDTLGSDIWQERGFLLLSAYSASFLVKESPVSHLSRTAFLYLFLSVLIIVFCFRSIQKSEPSGHRSGYPLGPTVGLYLSPLNTQGSSVTNQKHPRKRPSLISRDTVSIVSCFRLCFRSSFTLRAVVDFASITYTYTVFATFAITISSSTLSDLLFRASYRLQTFRLSFLAIFK